MIESILISIGIVFLSVFYVGLIIYFSTKEKKVKPYTILYIDEHKLIK